MFNLGTDDLAVKPYIPHKSLLQWICCKWLAFFFVTVSKLQYQNLFNHVIHSLFCWNGSYSFLIKAFYFEKLSIDCAHCTSLDRSNLTIIKIFNFSVKTLVTCCILLKLHLLLKKVWKNCQQMAPPYMFFIFLNLLIV